MAGALRKTMVYLGLAEEDDRYQGYDEDYDEDRSDKGAKDRHEERGAAVTTLPARPSRTLSSSYSRGVSSTG